MIFFSNVTYSTKGNVFAAAFGLCGFKLKSLSYNATTLCNVFKTLTCLKFLGFVKVALLGNDKSTKWQRLSISLKAFKSIVAKVCT